MIFLCGLLLCPCASFYYYVAPDSRHRAIVWAIIFYKRRSARQNVFTNLGQRFITFWRIESHSNDSVKVNVAHFCQRNIWCVLQLLHSFNQTHCGSKYYSPQRAVKLYIVTHQFQSSLKLPLSSFSWTSFCSGSRDKRSCSALAYAIVAVCRGSDWMWNDWSHTLKQEKRIGTFHHCGCFCVCRNLSNENRRYSVSDEPQALEVISKTRTKMLTLVCSFVAGTWNIWLPRVR